MVEIQEGLLKELRAFYVNGQTHYNCRLYAKEGYHFYDLQEYEENLKFNEEEKLRRIANNERIDDLIVEKNYTTFAITPITNAEEINKKFIAEKIDKN